jgi:ribosome maturation factor RimP
MASSQVDGVRAVVIPAIAGSGLVLEEITLRPAGRRTLLRIVVDLPEDVTGGVPVDAVAAASAAVSSALDDSEVMGGAAYVLEVTSPGVDRPLVDRRHWLRARGRLVRVTTPAGEVTGRLTDVDDVGPLVGDRRLSWSQVASGRVEVEFRRLDADADADADADHDTDAANDADDPDGVDDREEAP